MPNAADNASIQVIETLGSTISLIAIVTVYWKQSSEGQANFTSTLLLRSLCAFDFILAIVFAIGRAGHLNHDLCIFQGFMIQWFSTAIMLWVVMLSYIMYQWVVVKKHLKRMEKTVKKGIAAIVVFSFLLALIVLGVSGYGDDVYLWCWIEADQPLLRGFTFDFILGVSWCISLFALRKISTSITERIQSYSLSNHINELLGNNNFSVEKKLTLYIGSFIFIWFFAVLNRAVESALNRPFYPTAVLQAFFLSLQGLINSLLYGNIIDLKKLFSIEDMRKVFLGIYASDTRNMKEAVVDSRPQTRQKGTAPAPHQPPLLYSAKEYSIFISTLNMGEAPLESVIGDVKDWIVEGHDIYAIGLQECIDLVGLRELILNHLGGPSKYCMYTTSIGSGNTSLGYHGFIALTVFVKSSEVLAGHVFATKPAAEAAATGTDLIITTAQNKGAVGIALHIHDTSIGFVTCHLPSDSKGKSKLTKRNASAHAILKEVTLAPEDLGFDLHLQHDHVFVFGDLNYRMDTTGAGGGVNSLTGVAVACTIEKGTLHDDANWLARKYNLLRHPSDVLYPSFEEFKLIRTALHDSRGAWSSVLRADELRSIMDDGDAFCGFEEPMPCFPPSYKRRKGKIEGSCGDYTDFSAIIRGYSNTGEVENMLVNQPSVSKKDKKKKETIAGSIEKVQNFIQRPLSINAKLSAQEIRNLQSQLNKGNEGSGSDGSPSLSSRQFSADSGESADSEVGGEEEGESSSATRTGGGNRRRKAAVISTSNVIDPKKETDPSKLRPPSYTDRILLHSLPDRQERVTIQAYDFCDTLRVSDHRAVSMAVRLEVNSAVTFGLLKSGEAESPERSSYVSPPPVLPPLVAPPSPNLSSSQSSTNICTGYTKEPHFELYEVIISELSVCLYDLQDVEEEDDDEPIVYRDSHAVDDAIVSPSAREMLLRSSSSNVNVQEDNIEQPEDGFVSNPMRSSSSISPSSQETANSDRPLSPIARFGSTFFNNGERAASDHRWKRGGSRAGDESKADSISSERNAQGIELLPPSTSRDTYSTSTISTISGGNGHAISTATVPNVDLNTSGLNEIIVSCDAPNEPPVPPPRPQLTKGKSSRRKSLFSLFSSDTHREGEDLEAGKNGEEGQNVEDKRRQEQALIKELHRENLDWQNKLHKPNEWRKKKLEEERRMQKEQQQASLPNQLLTGEAVRKVSKKVKKSDDKNIYQVTVVFPLPSKDPLLAYRKVYDYGQVFESIAKEVLDPNAGDTGQDKDTMKVTKEELLRPFSIFPWITSTFSTLSIYSDKNSSSIFGSAANSSMQGRTQSTFGTLDQYRVKGCASIELGAHILIKLSNKAGYEFGSSVVCLSQLLHRDSNSLYSSHIREIPLTAGGQKRGHLTGKFSLRYIPSPLSTKDSV